MRGRQAAAPGAARKHTIYLHDTIGGEFGLGGDATLPADLVRWISGTFFVLFVASTVLFFPRPEIEVLADHRLITHGPYRWIRHPLYTALLLMSAGVALLLLNALLIVLFFVAWGIARRRAVLEEELLGSEMGFGDVYRSYMEGTGRFLPRRGAP